MEPYEKFHIHPTVTDTFFPKFRVLLFYNYRVFCHPSAGDEKKDLDLQRRLSSLNWITWEQLEIPIDFDESEAADKLMRKAQAGIK